MHNAPSVVYPVGRCAFQAGLLVALGVLGATLGTVFLIESNVQADGTRGAASWLVGMLGWLMWGAWAVLSWLRSPEGSLRWNPHRGEGVGNKGTWSWTDRSAHEPIELTTVACVLDLQGWILLCFAGPGLRRHWAWVERSRSPAHWRELRRALVSSRA